MRAFKLVPVEWWPDKLWPSARDPPLTLTHMRRFDNLRVQAGQCPPSASDPPAPDVLPNPAPPAGDLPADETNALEDPNLAAEVRQIDASATATTDQAGTSGQEAYDPALQAAP